MRVKYIVYAPFAFNLSSSFFFKLLKLEFKTLLVTITNEEHFNMEATKFLSLYIEDHTVCIHMYSIVNNC